MKRVGPAGAAPSPERQLALFMSRFDADVVRVARAARTTLRRLMPGAIELVYDNYNALAIGFSPTERASDAVVSIALYPRWVSLFFLGGAALPDPDGVLRGSGRKVRHVVLESASLLDTAPIRTLVALALARSPTAMDGTKRTRTIVKAVSARQRPRRPARA